MHIGHEITIQGIKIHFLQMKKAHLMLRILNNPVAQRILKLLEFNGEMNVNQIYISLNLPQSAVSLKLSPLRRNQILNTRRVGKNIFYSLNPERFDKLNIFLKILSKHSLSSK